jgi:DNA-binding CsgD family transcriptional regulator/tetratricopeptide (TPR) repeat protein
VPPATSSTSTIMCADVALTEHAHLVSEVARARSARVIDTVDGRIIVAFDSASAAVAASVEMQQAITGSTSAVPPRIGLATGDVLWLDGACTGTPVGIAAALFAHAQPGQILVNNVARLLAANGDGHGYAEVGRIHVDLDGEGRQVDVYSVGWQPLATDDDGDAGVDRPSVPLPAAVATPSRQRLVGRDAEWSVLADAWRRAEGGTREVVLIGGEAGAGKTRLAAEFARHCHDAGAIVLFGTCDEELALPYQPWVHALDHLLRSLPGNGRPINSDRDLGDLLVLLPQLERMLPGLPRPAPADPETERYLLFSAVDRVLASSAHQAPLLVLLDDVHWAGRQTLELLRHLVRSGSASRLMIVATFRDGAAELGDPLAESLVDLQRSDSVTRIRLGGLDAAGVELYVAGALDQDLDGELRILAAAAAERSGGNAFFLGELWRHLIHHGVVDRVGGRWVVRRDIAGVGSPDSVKDVVAGRMARLTLRARRLLELAAAAGQRVEFPVLSLASAINAEEVGAGLDELVDSGFLVNVGGHLLTYQFMHALVRDTVDEVMSPSVQAGLHLRIAEALEHIYESDPRSVYADLARHFGAAAAVGGVERAIRYGRLAADQAKSTGAYDEAISHLDAILRMMPDDSIDAAEVLVDLGLVQMRSGHAYKAQDTHQRAFDIARRNGWAEQAARAALGYEEAVHQPGAPGGPAVRMVSEAIALIGDEQVPLRVHLQASLSRGLYLAGDREDAVAAADVAMEMARAIDDLECVIAVLQALIIVTPEPLRLLDASAELRDVSIRIGDTWSATYATANMFRILVELGNLDEAREVLKQHQMLSNRGRFLVFQFMGHVYEALLALAAGLFDEAEAAAERAHTLGDSSDTVFDAGVYGLQMFAIRREQGRLAEVLPVMRVLSARSDADQQVWRPGLTALYAELGMLDESRRELDALAPHGFAAVPRDSVWPACLTFLAEACVACGATQYAPILMRELDLYAGRNLMVAMTICFGPADRLRGGLAHLLGFDDLADGYFRAALTLADTSSSPVWRARVQYEWAMLAADTGDLATATGLAEQSHATASVLHMRTLVERAAALVERLNSPSAAPVTFDGMSERELDVLRLIAEGCSNREIGERLFISQHTAANHVRSILQKTGCANRAEAAAYAVRRQLVNPSHN